MTDTITEQRRADLRTIDAICAHGGGFARAIGYAASRADPENLARIKAAFPEIWAKYAAMARQDETTTAG